MKENIILHEVVIKQFFKTKKRVKSKDYCQADHNNVYCFRTALWSNRFHFFWGFENYSTFKFTIADKHQRPILPDRIKQISILWGTSIWRVLLFTAFHPVIKLKILQSHYHVISQHPILQDYSCTWKFSCSCYYQWDLQIHLSAVTFTLKLLAHTLKFIRSQSVTIQTDDLTSPEVVYIEN